MSDSLSIDPARGPAAHEDLTIAEHLKVMLAGNEHRPDERGFQDEHGQIIWVSRDRAEDFIRESGALHPSDYLARHGRPWQDDFFSCESRSQSTSS